MKRITPTETFKRAVRRGSRPKQSPALPTSLRVPYSVSVDESLHQLLKRLHNEFNVNCSKELEPLIKKWAFRKARNLNEQRA